MTVGKSRILAEKILELRKLKGALQAKKGLEDLYYFNREVLEKGNKDRQKNVVPHVHGEWWDWYRKSRKRHQLILVPRGTLKTTFFTVGATLQQIAKNRNSRILIANAKKDIAEKFLSEIKERLKSDENLTENYGEFYNPDLKWTDNEIEVVGRNIHTREPTVMAVGVGMGLAGYHFTHIFADDLMNKTFASSREMTQKVIEWWNRLHALLDYEIGTSLTIGTRWSFFDLYQYIKDERSDQVDIFERGAYNPDGTPYYPELLGEKKLEELKADQDTYTFSCFFLNDPIDEDTVVIGKSNVHYVGNCHCGEVHRLPPDEEMNNFVMSDPASSQEITADKAAIIAISVDRQANWWVRETQSGRWKSDEFIERLFQTNERWKPEIMSLELVSQAGLLTSHIHDEEVRRNTFLPLKVITTRANVKKLFRIRASLQPIFQRGKVFIGREMKELEDQLARYPLSKHDDLIDALSDCTEIFYTPGGEVEEEPDPSSLGYKIQQSIKRAEQERQKEKSYRGLDDGLN